jgi:uncharacterized membrane protein
MTAQTAVLIVVFVAVVLACAVAGATGWYYLRRQTLRRKFGPEYDRAVAEFAADGDDRVAAERELLDRERRHAEFDIRPLPPADRDRYADEWRAVQAQFIEDPVRAVMSSDALVTRVAVDRGYPTTDYADQLRYLSVDHARTLSHYRDAHDIYLRGQRAEASTEELRQALVHYRELFADLLGDGRPASGLSDPTGGYPAVSARAGTRA